MGMADLRELTPLQRALEARDRAVAQRDDAVEALRVFQWVRAIAGYRCNFCDTFVRDHKDQLTHQCQNFPGLRTPIK